MPTVVLSKSVLEGLIGKKLPLKELKDRISYLGTDLERIEGDEIHVEIFPNRPDMLSEQGFGRAFGAFIGSKPGLKKYDVKPYGSKVVVDKNVTMRPYTACAVVKNLNFDDEGIREIVQLQEKLAITLGRNRKKAAYGLYPLNVITFPISYKAEDASKVKFQPLEYPEEIVASEVVEKHSKGRAYKHLTEGWKKFPFFFDAKGKVLSMLPFTNSHDTGKIDETTKEVFIECSGTDLRTCEIALAILTTALADIGGDIYSLEIEYHDSTITTPDLNPTEWDLDVQYINKRLGLTLSDDEAGTLLEHMGFGYKNKKVLVPPYRADILHQADFAEDIAIAYGYENFVPTLPNVSTIGQEDALEVFKKKVAYILSGIGFQELNTYHLMDREDLVTKMDCNIPCIELVNSVSGEFGVLRSWMIPSLMAVLQNNKHHEFPQRIFDIGTIFTKNDKTETNVEEAFRLAVLTTHQTADFTEAKQILDYVLRMVNVPYEIEETQHASFLPGRCARVLVKGKKVAYIGELSPHVLANFELEMPVAGFELNISDLFSVM